MATDKAHTPADRPRSFFGIRLSIWAAAIIVISSLLGTVVKEPLIGVAIGLLCGSAFISYFDRNHPKSSRILGLVMMLLVVLWFVALRLIEAG